jgi:hypothetical protein
MNTAVSLPLLVISLAGAAASAQTCGGPLLDLSLNTPEDNFGIAVSASNIGLNGRGLMVGVPGHDMSSVMQMTGAVKWYIVVDGQWQPFQAIAAVSPGLHARFGSALEYTDPALIVGAPTHGGGGAAYIFHRNGMAWEQKRLHSGMTGDGVGNAVSISTSWAAVGVPNADVLGDANAGRVQMYRRDWNTNEWNPHASLYYWTENRSPDDHLGTSVSTDGDVVLAGIPDYDSFSGASAGAALVFRYSDSANAFGAEQFLSAPDGQPGDRFGATVKVVDRYAFISAPGREVNNGTDVGVVYVFYYQSDEWQHLTTLTPVVASSNAGFGASLDAYITPGNAKLVVGSSGQRQAHVFSRTSTAPWVLDMRIVDPDGPDGFAASVALFDQEIYIGDHLDDAHGADAGTVYIYERLVNSNDTCIGARVVSPGNSYEGCTQHATVDGSASCGGIQSAPDVWFKYTATASGFLPLNTHGSGIDTILSVHSDCPGTSANTLVCNDDAGIALFTSSVTLPVTVGQTYSIRVAGKALARGPFTLTVGALQPGNPCYANCDASSTAPVLNVADFTCFLQRFAGGQHYANCDASTTQPVLNVADFTCFLQRFAAGCP